MSSENSVVRGIVRQNEVVLKRHLILSKTVLDLLRNNGVIPDVIKRRILAEPTQNQVTLLLECIEKQGLTSFRKFMDVLRNTGHNWLVEKMLDTDVNIGQQGSRKAEIPNMDVPMRPMAGAMSGPGILGSSMMAGGTGHSLASLLRVGNEPDLVPRGAVNARQLFAQPPLPDNLHFYGAMMPQLAQQQSGGQQQEFVQVPRTQTSGHIPMSLYGLNKAFADEEQKHKQALSILQQEETAIRQLMEQNARQQGVIRRKQQAVQDINDKLKDIHVKANDVYEPVPNVNIGQYRLQQLNQIPWSID